MIQPPELRFPEADLSKVRTVPIASRAVYSWAVNAGSVGKVSDTPKPMTHSPDPRLSDERYSDYTDSVTSSAPRQSPRQSRVRPTHPRHQK